MTRYELGDRVALVTGAARGIGFETARALISRGASVAVVDLEIEAAEAAAAQLHDTRAIGLAADVTDRGAMQQAVATTVERFGALDVVVANAGIASRAATFRAIASEGFERVIDVNPMGVVRTVDAALPELIRRRGHAVERTTDDPSSSSRAAVALPIPPPPPVMTATLLSNSDTSLLSAAVGAVIDFHGNYLWSKE